MLTLEEIKPLTIPFILPHSAKADWETSFMETKVMLEIFLPTLFKTSKTLLSHLKELSLQQLEFKTIKNLLIWSMKKCSLLNCQPKIPKEPHQLIWEVKSET
jgi:hypothetical protein